MKRSSKDDRATLSAIARRAMIERGMEPDFSPAAERELAKTASVRQTLIILAKL